MSSRMFTEMPTTSSMLSAYASLSTSMMLFRTMYDQLVPTQVRSYVIDVVKCYWKKPKASDQLTLLFEERDGHSPNDMFYAVEDFLSTKITTDSKRLKITKSMNDEHIKIKLADSEKIVDSFEGVTVTWKYHSQQQNQRRVSSGDNQEKTYMELIFDKNYKDIIISSYLPFIIKKAQEIKNQGKAVQLHSLQSYYSGHREGVNLDHPSTFETLAAFETLAMDQKTKKEIMDDLDLFLKRKDFYKKVGKAWKRGYLLYGPPGTGKSSLIAAMANYLKFDIYELQLMHVHGDASLREILLQTSNRSILVIEDIDCSILPDRNGTASSNGFGLDKSKFSLSGLLNFIDGLWSCCGDERIIIFTTNHKERLDPALLRPGRMDVHIHMSYLTMDGFQTLAANYLNIQDHHWRFEEISDLIKCKKVTPAEVAEELMKSDNVEVVLEGVVKFLKRKRIEEAENAELNNGIDGEEKEIHEAKKAKVIS